MRKIGKLKKESKNNAVIIGKIWGIVDACFIKFRATRSRMLKKRSYTPFLIAKLNHVSNLLFIT